LLDVGRQLGQFNGLRSKNSEEERSLLLLFLFKSVGHNDIVDLFLFMLRE